MFALIATSLASLAIALAAALLCRRQTLRAAAVRRDLLRDCAGLFDETPTRAVDRAGYGTLSGRYRGLPVRLSLLAEALVFRRLPQLWCRIELRTAIGGTERLGIVRRPANVAFDAAASELPVCHDVPAAWPADTLVRGTRRSGGLLAILADRAGPLLADPRLKEILVTPRGLRVAMQVCEGQRGAYLLMRASRFASDRVAPGQVLGALDGVVDLAHALLQRNLRHERDLHHARLPSEA